MQAGGDAAAHPMDRTRPIRRGPLQGTAVRRRRGGGVALTMSIRRRVAWPSRGRGGRGGGGRSEAGVRWRSTYVVRFSGRLRLRRWHLFIVSRSDDAATTRRSLS